MFVSAQDLELIHNKLDRMLDSIIKLQVITAELSEHQKSINGTVARHEKDFAHERAISNELIKELKIKFNSKCDSIENDIVFTKRAIWKAQGAIIAITVFSTVLGIVGALKVLGLL